MSSDRTGLLARVCNRFAAPAATDHVHDDQCAHAADSHEGSVRFARIDVEGAPKTASMVGVQSIPTVVLFDPDGNEVERLTGVPPLAELQRLIERGATGSKDTASKGTA